MLSDMFEGTTATQRREKDLKEYLKMPPNPVFADLEHAAEGPFTFEHALEVCREDFNASAYKMPSPVLLQTIRAGVLMQPGFVKPRLIADAMKRAPGLVVGDGGVITAPASAIPRLDSADEFCMAMFSTILQWLSLTRTPWRSARRKAGRSLLDTSSSCSRSAPTHARPTRTCPSP